MKKYHVLNSQAVDSENKLKHSVDQLAKVATQANPGSKKLKTLEAQTEKVSLPPTYITYNHFVELKKALF